MTTKPNPTEISEKVTIATMEAATTFADCLVIKAGELHPTLGPVVSALVQMALTEENIEKLKKTIEDLLVAVMGDEFPVFVDAGVVEFIDERNNVISILVGPSPSWIEATRFPFAHL